MISCPIPRSTDSKRRKRSLEIGGVARHRNDAFPEKTSAPSRKGRLRPAPREGTGGGRSRTQEPRGRELLKVYHLISRNYHGVLLQLLAGLATYLLLVLYFHRKYGERPSLHRLRSLRQQIRQEANATFVSVYIPVYTIDIDLIFFSVIVLLWTQAQAKS